MKVAGYFFSSKAKHHAVLVYRSIHFSNFCVFDRDRHHIHIYSDHLFTLKGVIWNINMG